MKRIWTEEDSQQLIELAESGKSAIEIGDIMGRKASTIRAHAKNLRLQLERPKRVRSNMGASVAPLPPAPAVHRSRTARLFGDPPIGRSALDQKMGAA